MDEEETAGASSRTVLVDESLLRRVGAKLSATAAFFLVKP